MAERDDELTIDTEADARYPRGWSGNPRFTGWKIAVGVAMLFGVPVTLWVLVTVFWLR